MAYSQSSQASNTDGQNFSPVPVYQHSYTNNQQAYGTQDMNHNIPNYSHGMGVDPYKPQYEYGQQSQNHQNVYDNTDSGLGYESNGLVYNGEVSTMNYYSNESGNQFSQNSQFSQNPQITQQSQLNQQGNTTVSVANNQLARSQSPPTYQPQPGKRGPGRPTKKVFAPGKDKAYVCPTCFKPLGTYQSLRKHMVTHTGERQYSCHLCSNSYTQKHNLTKHLLVHSGEKPFSCEYCGASYRTRHLLKNHMKRHQKNKIGTTSKFGSAAPVYEQTNAPSKLREMLMMNNHSESVMDTSFDHNESSLDSSTLTDNSAEFNSPEREMCEMNNSFKEMSPEYESMKQVPRTSLTEKFESMGNKVVNQSEKSNTEPVKEFEAGKVGGKKFGAQSEKQAKLNLECDKCEQVFESRIKFMRHKKEHNNSQKSLSCDFCNASFRWKAALDIHMRKHKGQKLPSYELKGLKIKNGNRITLKIGTSDKKEINNEKCENVEKQDEAAILDKKPEETKTDKKASSKKQDVKEAEKEISEKTENITPDKPAKSGKKLNHTVSNDNISPKSFLNEEKVSETPEVNNETENHDTRKRKLSNRKHVENPFIGSMPRSEIAQKPENQTAKISNRAHKKATYASDAVDVAEKTKASEKGAGKVAAKFECDLCGQTFTANYSLRRHKQNKICTK